MFSLIIVCLTVVASVVAVNVIEARRRARLTPEQRVKEDDAYKRTGGL